MFFLGGARPLDGDSAVGIISRFPGYVAKGTSTSWYKGWNLTEAERDRFRDITKQSQAAKSRALRGECDLPKHVIPVAALDPLSLMPQQAANGLRALSLFSGCGGMDIGFERAGYTHVASYDILEETGKVLGAARPNWTVMSGAAGDVTKVSWSKYRGKVDVVHGGPPCQPFSNAGYQNGASDIRDMVPEFVRAVLEMSPSAFLMENVSGLGTKKFKEYLQETFYSPLSREYSIHTFVLNAEEFGVPQKRKRMFFVGFKSKSMSARFEPPAATHHWPYDNTLSNLPKTMGAREALGLHPIGLDGLAPTIRSGWTGPRHTTSVVNSSSAMTKWDALQIWPNGVAATPKEASDFVAKHGHFRLSIKDCMVLQCFPEDWPFDRPVYKALGLIGNSVTPPMAFAAAASIARLFAA